MLVVRTQHDYYRAARARLRVVERRLRLDEEYLLDTTSTVGQRPRLVSVNQLVYFLLAIIAVADLVGIVIILSR